MQVSADGTVCKVQGLQGMMKRLQSGPMAGPLPSLDATSSNAQQTTLQHTLHSNLNRSLVQCQVSAAVGRSTSGATKHAQDHKQRDASKQGAIQSQVCASSLFFVLVFGCTSLPRTEHHVCHTCDMLWPHSPPVWHQTVQRLYVTAAGRLCRHS